MKYAKIVRSLNISHQLFGFECEFVHRNDDRIGPGGNVNGVFKYFNGMQWFQWNMSLQAEIVKNMIYLYVYLHICIYASACTRMYRWKRACTWQCLIYGRCVFNNSHAKSKVTHTQCIASARQKCAKNDGMQIYHEDLRGMLLLPLLYWLYKTMYRVRKKRN